MLLKKVGAGTLSSPRSHQEVDIVRACKEVLASVSDNLTALSFEESLMDKVLCACQRIIDGAQTVLASEGKTTLHSPRVHPMLQLVADVPLLASHVALWSSFFDGLNLLFLHDLLAGAADQVKIVGHQTTSLLQGCDGYLTSLMSESSRKLTTAVLSLCMICGELSLATDSTVIRLDHSTKGYNTFRLSRDVNKHFLQGCIKFAQQTLAGGVSALKDYQTRAMDRKDSTDPTQ
ncbi:hypothetical protein EGW08_022296, partial [Elysia chlorotica]